MAKSIFATILVASLAISQSFALQVTPNSQCSSVCMDDESQDKSDPNVSNTEGSDIVCHDENYQGTLVGQKFKRCLDCLQNSSDKSETQSDLQWYLYNLRFAVNTCVYGLSNASDPLSSPCSIQTSCGPLVGAFQDGMDAPTSANKYSYCDAFGGSFQGPRLAPCQKCLRLTDEQKYMGNFIVALKAGCTQKPEDGKTIGLDGTLFSEHLVNATTTSIAQPTATPHEGKSGLSTGAYAGIGVAGAVALAFIAAICIVGRRKQKAKKEREMISSGLDNRFGNGRITVPVQGAYGDPYPPKPTAYQSVGLVNVQPKAEKSYSPYIDENDHQAHEAYFSKPSYPRPFSMISQHTIPRETAPPVPYATYNPARHERSGSSFSRSGSTQPADTPSHSPHSVSDSMTQLHKSSPINETSNLTRSKGPPVIGSGLPKSSAPRRRSSSNASRESFQVRPGRHTRDLSASRDTDVRNEITGPIITVSTRFDEDEDARRKAERERLYKQGFKHKTEENTSPDNELWPGKY